MTVTSPPLLPAGRPEKTAPVAAAASQTDSRGQRPHDAGRSTICASCTQTSPGSSYRGKKVNSNSTDVGKRTEIECLAILTNVSIGDKN